MDNWVDSCMRASELLKEVKFSSIRGNASEIRYLAGQQTAGSGVDVSALDKITEENLKEAEKKAGILIQEADAKAASIVEEAKAKAKAMKEETASKIRSGSQEAEEAAHKASEAKLAEAEEQAQKEADALRQLVEPKREEALEAVITSLV